MISKIDLSGEWQLLLDENMKLNLAEICYNDTISLPSTTSFSKKGKKNDRRETGFLTDEYKFEGNAWYKKTINLEGFTDGKAMLFLERTRISTVYVNGKNAGCQDSFVAPHVFDVTDLLCEGENTIEICVANKGYKTGGGHMTSQDTQSNWNGITGEISLRIYGESYILNAVVEGDIHTKTFKISADVFGKSEGVAKISASSLTDENITFSEKEFPFSDGKLYAEYSLPEAELWSEFSPNTYQLFIEIDGDVYDTIAGLREFRAEKDKFTINGKKTFLRGKHDGLIFPKTGYAPTTVSEWLEVLSISKSYGFNHYRFHTCCPPEAAFVAADMLGIYMEPQLPFWGTITVEGEEKHDATQQEFLINEGFLMMKEFGNHPSFCMMSMGNELWGNKDRINEIIGGYKKIDKRHLYTQGSNNFQWFPNVIENDDFFVGVRLANDRLIRGSYAMCDAPLGHIQTDRPSTRHHYDDLVIPKKKASSTEVSADGTVQIQFGTTMKTVMASEADADFIPNVPIVTHEIGQFETFPDFNEIEKYTGPLKARNFEVFRERLQEKGISHLSDKFFRASGKLAASCYKEELEAVFRSKTLAGFQLLDLQDFTGQGTALVGILNAFMENKGNITREEWVNFCNDIVILARFDSYTYQSGDEFNADIEIVNFSNNSLDNKTVKTSFVCEETGNSYSSGIIKDNGENYISAGKISIIFPEITKPSKATFTVEIDGTDIKNTYTLWLYPKTESVDISGAYIFESVNKEAEGLLSQGKTVLIIPQLEKVTNSIKGFYCADFWCYPMFRSISEMMGKPNPVGTMGLLIDDKHPALSQFPTEYYSTHQWWEIVENSVSEILDDKHTDKHIIVQTIDNFERNHVLGLLYEYSHKNGKVVVLNADAEKLTATPEGRQFIKSVIHYCKA